jgi:hypothetical protein
MTMKVCGCGQEKERERRKYPGKILGERKGLFEPEQ